MDLFTKLAGILSQEPDLFVQMGETKNFSYVKQYPFRYTVLFLFMVPGAGTRSEIARLYGQGDTPEAAIVSAIKIYEARQGS